MKVLNALYITERWFYRILQCIWKVFVRIVIAVILIGLLSVGAAYGIFHNLYVQSRDTEYKVLSNISEGSFRHLMNTQIFDAGGNKISEIKSADFEYVEIKDISPYIQEGYIAVEDRAFKFHPGINVKAIGRAAVSVVKNHGAVTQGGSTITQQLVKNTLLSQEQTLSRKAVEAMLALDIEKKFSKADIMEYYLNSCYYGNGCYGVGSACRYYFDKKPSEVTPAEAALIVGMSNNPNNVNPVASEERAREKRHTVLKQMLSQGVITDKEYKTADTAAVEAKKITPDRTPESYQSSYAVHCAAIELMKKDGFDFQYTFKDKKEYKSYKKKYSKAYSTKTALIRGGGYQIYTSFDQDDQKNLQKAVDTTLDTASKKKQKDDDRYLLQGAAVSVDNKTGYVTAIVGGRGTSDQYNRAFLSSRQSGSAIKPLIDYGPAFDTGKYFPSLVVEDAKIENGPKNSGGGYKGNVTIRYAIKDSINTVAYNTLQQIGIGKGLGYLGDLGFSSLSYLDNNSSSVSIGGFTNGVHVTDMARAYAAIENGGIMRDRTCVTRIVSETAGTVYQSNTDDTKQVYDSATAYMLTSCMEDVFDKGGTGHGLLPEGQHCAGKTGTTNDLKDGWFCGYNTDRTCVVWVGNDDNTVVPHNYGATYAGKIWSSYMKDAGGGMEEFDVPDTVVKLSVGAGGYPTNSKSGKKDYFSREKSGIASQSKHSWELENQKKVAEEKVAALEGIKIQSLSDYFSGYKTALKAAQDAVAAISDADARTPYLERINKKVEALTDESDGWSDVSEAESDYKAQAESDRQEQIKEEQEEKNRKEKVDSEVAKFEEYITMVTDLKVYSKTQKNLLSKAYAAWEKISDPTRQSEELQKYNDASAYVQKLRTEYEARKSQKESEERSLEQSETDDKSDYDSEEDEY